MSSVVFKKAVKSKSKLRLALSGPSGAGKTMSALRLATGLVPNGRIAVLDTERGSASLYADKFDFDVIEMAPPYHPDSFRAVIKSAEDAGYDILILDSITHEWQGVGGVLDLHSQFTKTMRNANSFMAWNQASPIHQRFVDDMVGSKIHIIATMRSKTSYVQSEENGRKSVKKMGEAPVQRDGIEFEFTTVLDLSVNGNYAIASKDRTGIFSPDKPIIITEETGKQILDWLESGVEPGPAEWRPSADFQEKVTRWLNSAHEKNAFDEALNLVPAHFSDPNEVKYITEQLKLAKDMFNNDDDGVPEFNLGSEPLDDNLPDVEQERASA